MTNAIRLSLPDVRQSVTHKTIIHDLSMGDVSLFLTVGMYPDETDVGTVPGEVWINIGKVGTTLRGLTDTIAIELSLLLQYGVPLRDLVDQFRGQTYAPLGETTNPDIPVCSSIIDYVVQWLEHRFLQKEEEEE